MLFNSFEFIFIFLPSTLLVFWVISRVHSSRHYLAIAFLIAASLFFYGWWHPPNLKLIIVSLVFNYLLGNLLTNFFRKSFLRVVCFIGGLSVNLALIGYFKYANFFIENVNTVLDTAIETTPIILPLAISFFTFQQIAYLVDVYRGETKNYTFLDYCLFITFFPQLIAGPIVYHKDIIPQFNNRSIYRFNSNHLAVGLTIFFMGMFKKVVFADEIARYANPVFDAAALGQTPTFLEAWIGVLAYTLQIYFDFSGYSDMAIGIAFLFGIRLPLNFNSPYKAVSIIDFWRRWHITLSHFLRDYLYIPLGGNRQGKVRQATNLMITMLLGGLWHGAGWTFVIWGGLHGSYLVINHQWRSFQRWLGGDLNKSHWLSKRLGWLITFFAVVVAWVFFRSPTMTAAMTILGAMFTIEEFSLTDILDTEPVYWIVVLLLITWFTPNVQQWMGKYSPTLERTHASVASGEWGSLWHKLQWQPNWIWALITSTITLVSLFNLIKVSEFLYFQF